MLNQLLAALSIAVCALCYVPDAESAQQTLYAAQNGSGSTCSSSTPCTLAIALSTVAGGDNDIIILYGANEGHGTGIYSADLDITNSTNHDNLTITATDAVKAALTFNEYGIPSGTDNRPYIYGGVTFGSGVSGAAISYLRVRLYSSAQQSYTGVIDVNTENVTVSYCEIYNGGQGVTIQTGKRNMLFTYNYFHNLGTGSGDPDTHCFEIYSTGTEATSYGEGIVISHNTIHTVGGDGIQEGSYITEYGGDGQATTYITFANNNVYDCAEQAVDLKGTSYMRISNNLFHGNGQGSISLTDDPPVPTMSYIEIYNNTFYDEDGYALARAQDAGCSNVLFYNNVLYNVNNSPAYTGTPAVHMCGDAGSTYYSNTMYNCSIGNNSSGVAPCGSASNIKNNIFYNNGTGAKGSIGTYYACTYSGTPDYNYIYGTSTYTGNHVTSTCYTSGNCPGFTNIGANTYTLMSDSPAVGVGAALASTYNTDAAGTSRPQATTWDVGAFEYAAGQTQSAITGISITGGSFR